VKEAVNILVLTPYLPTPPNTGGRRRMHALISRLARFHNVTLLSFVDGTGEPLAVEAARRICTRVVVVRNEQASASGLRKRWLQARSIASYSSAARSALRTPAMQEAIDALAREIEFDLTLVEFAQMAGYSFPTSGPVVLDEHNIEYDILRRTFETERGPLRKLFSFVEHRKLRAEERAAWSRLDGCVFTSSRDYEIARAAEKAIPMSVVPNGVDVHEFVPVDVARNKDVLFFGADFYPNTDAIRFYADEVFPSVLADEPNARLVVVGQVGDALRDHPRPGVLIVGAVPDIRAYISRAAVVVAPLRIGGGTRLKILEAMAMGRPVVATRIGAEGIDAIPERDLLIADEPTELARATVRVLSDARLASTVGMSGRALVQRLYDWEVLGSQLDRFIRTLLAQRRTYRFALGRERVG